MLLKLRAPATGSQRRSHSMPLCNPLNVRFHSLASIIPLPRRPVRLDRRAAFTLSDLQLVGHGVEHVVMYADGEVGHFLHQGCAFSLYVEDRARGIPGYEPTDAYFLGR